MSVDRNKFPEEVESFGSSTGYVYVSLPKVMKSAAGWYMGTTCWDPTYESEMPYDRDTGYYATEQQAKEVLDAMQVGAY